ncbi:DUF6883 domain-containing protein [Sphingomonas sp.]|uniref:DUF6883 domain-containing protein n=1 Tax=Sphingomonas sp. TaxID=28214 RepID=UPI00333FAAAE
MTSIDGQHVIELAKITDYLLSAEHPIGRAKAAYFNAFGLDSADPIAFANALEAHARTRPIVRSIEGPFGTKREVRCSISTPDRRNPCIIVIWFRPLGTNTHRMITAYPAPSDQQKGRPDRSGRPTKPNTKSR